MMIQLPMEIAARFRLTVQPSHEWVTLVQCGWANRLIYSADLDALDYAADVLAQERAGKDAEMGRRARLPFFGFGYPTELQDLWAAPPEGSPGTNSTEDGDHPLNTVLA